MTPEPSEAVAPDPRDSLIERLAAELQWAMLSLNSVVQERDGALEAGQIIANPKYYPDGFQSAYEYDFARTAALLAEANKAGVLREYLLDGGDEERPADAHGGAPKRGDAPWPTHAHLKSGKLVREFGRGRLEATLEPVVVYLEGNGDIWVRHESVFDEVLADGNPRFLRLVSSGASGQPESFSAAAAIRALALQEAAEWCDESYNAAGGATERLAYSTARESILAMRKYPANALDSLVERGIGGEAVSAEAKAVVRAAISRLFPHAQCTASGIGQ
jgi:hypothetical protein